MNKISENAKIILEKRYLLKDNEGNPIETPEMLFTRIAKDIALADKIYDPHANVDKITAEFFDLISNLDFLPNSPTLMNAGTPLGQLSACFVLPVGDSIDEIFDSVKNAAIIHKTGGGTGFSFSHLRPRNDLVRSTYGVSSGPISFMEVFDSATNAIKQGGKRRGANMGILNVHHPDILEFITAKDDLSRLTNFNISVALTDEFMTAAIGNMNYNLINPRNKEIVKKISAAGVFELIIHHAWKTGEPGIVFIDKINNTNPTPKIGKIESTNPCGEQPLLPYESCNLGSINMVNMLTKKESNYYINWEKFEKAIDLSVHFLDNVIDRNKYPLEQIKKITQGNRKIGLGIMGWADILYMLQIPYNSDEAIRLAGKTQKFISEKANQCSLTLAEQRGVFPNWERSIYKKQNISYRNATRTTIAPTGTIALIADVSSGIEPVFALAFTRKAMEKEKLIYTHPYFRKIMEDKRQYNESFADRLSKNGSIAHFDDVDETTKRIFVTAHEIAPEWHVKMQAAFQKYTDNAVSKTINFPNNATSEDVKKAYHLAYETECKGITIYRDGSREGVLHAGTEIKKEEEGKKYLPRKRPQITVGKTIKMETGCGHLYVTINEDEMGLFEVFASMGKAGGCANSYIEAISRLISLSLRSNIDVYAIIRQLKGIRCPNPTPSLSPNGKVLSCADGIAKALEIYLDEKESLFSFKMAIPLSGNPEIINPDDVEYDGICPDCGGILIRSEGCAKCFDCGFSKCE